MNKEKKLILTGIPASTGTIVGRARVFVSNADMSSFAEGDILVTTLTDPTMIQVILRAAAIVTNMGGITSHPAIISREMGIPCVVNTKTATEKITNGMLIEVNGTTGEIYALD